MYSLLLYQPRAPYEIYMNIKDITPTYSGASVTLEPVASDKLLLTVLQTVVCSIVDINYV